MITVSLHEVIIHAHHGLYEEEQKTGNNYQVDVDVKFEERKINNVDDTVNYETLYQIVRNKMQVPVPLLEQVCEGIIRKIKHEYKEVKEICVSIYKLQAPIENFQGKVGVTMRKKFDD